MIPSGSKGMQLERVVFELCISLRWYRTLMVSDGKMCQLTYSIEPQVRGYSPRYFHHYR